MACALGSVLVGSQVGEARTRLERPVEHVPGEIVVKLKDSAPEKMAAALEALQSRLGRSAVVSIRDLKTDATTHVLRISRDGQINTAIQALKSDESVEIAEPNYIYRAFEDGEPVRIASSARAAARTLDETSPDDRTGGLPNDPDFNKTWGLKNTGQADEGGQIGKADSDIHVVPLWQEGFRGSRKVLVAVIDTGIDWNHPDLKDNLYTNPGEAGDKAANGKDDDGNGFEDDIHGWNFEAKTNNSNDDNRHGTHCSGTIGGVGNNGVGVVGVNWEVSLMPIKFLDAGGGGTLDAAVDAINYATMMKVNVMSNSWGGGGVSQTMRAAIEKARDAGILFVAAAGNDRSNNDSSPSYPASYDVSNVISVAATDNQDKVAEFSNYGARTVHVAAPGLNIYSTSKDGKYEVLSGTSMATPHVSGIAALLLSAGVKAEEIKDRLIRTSDPVRSLKRKVVANGRVNAYSALHGIVPPSNEPDPSLWKTEAELIESDHPYPMNADKTYTIRRPGARYIRVHFEKVAVENRYDKVMVQNPATKEVVEELTGNLEDYLSEYIEGDKVEIRLKADDSVDGWGFKVDKIQVIY